MPTPQYRSLNSQTLSSIVGDVPVATLPLFTSGNTRGDVRSNVWSRIAEGGVDDGKKRPYGLLSEQGRVNQEHAYFLRIRHREHAEQYRPVWRTEA